MRLSLALLVFAALVASVLPLARSLPAQLAPEGFPGAHDVAGTIDVQSFNIRYGTANDGANSWRYRYQMVFDTIRGQQMVGLQEALYSQITEIIQALPQYSYIGVGCDDGNKAGEYSAILYLTAQYKVSKQGTFWFCDRPDQPGCTSYGNSIPRICTWGLFQDLTTGRSFFHYNVHLDHNSANSRLMSVQQLIAHIRSSALANPGVPFIVTGDFNNASESSPEIELMRSSGFVDTFRVLYPDATNTGTFNGWTGNKTGAKIDFVWVSNSSEYGAPFIVSAAEINHYNVNGKYPSDHFPVEASLVFPRLH